MPCARPPGAPPARTGSRITPSGSPEEGIDRVVTRVVIGRSPSAVVYCRGRKVRATRADLGFWRCARPGRDPACCLDTKSPDRVKIG